MDDEQGDVGHGCPFNAITSKTLDRMKDYVWIAAPRDSKGRPEAVSLWVMSPPRRDRSKKHKLYF
ncbi:hypothetical protein A9Q74_10045 [Colwellia sp. 39_35_sub15_T18]|nr:hypothetical protein A9Q74_10045 [Colwellia sp. 39_35_sub15_T18]